MIDNLCEIFDVEEDELFNIKFIENGVMLDKCRIHNNEFQRPNYGGFTRYDLDISELGHLKVIKNPFCKNCGKEINDYKYCPNCGTKRGEQDE